MAREILGSEFEVTTVETVAEAWRALIEDAAVRVLFLGDEDHDTVIELVERVRASDDARVQATPIVQVTATGVHDKARQVALASGVTDFIDKPFEPSVLLARARSTSTHSSARQRLAEQRRSHDRDTETGLGNRRYFFERLGQTLSFARRSGQPTSLVHLHFEGLTENLARLGRHFRETRMTKVGQTLAASVRREDTAYRTGPEHFCFILPGTGADGAKTVCARLEPSLDGIGMLRGDGILAVVASLEVQEFRPGEETSVDDCLREARESMAPMIFSEPR
ncbi:MAG: diguanylate cyclase [Gammaproteobacteria bacterium]|nr:diguanylate cyclase [Gammaproteobacteria bacterium]